ncbi:uncharacterized protein BXZ73DRAFT_106033 [Epithele typhae]|uniref:uncharacterized protein n=1 Tax=Epithele typhae TaxID=378194 RepID=UPI0020076CDE|nr:uncharacterized protein BXZ73DRAFT_106033 [Epithele typhae]KAH9915966.1 hypothetical protein BXZ73DRAFT_106033 [Epithele typhae]
MAADSDDRRRRTTDDGRRTGKSGWRKTDGVQILNRRPTNRPTDQPTNRPTDRRLARPGWDLDDDPAPQHTVGTVPISTSNSLHSWGSRRLSRIHLPDLDPTPVGVGPNELLELVVDFPAQDGCPSHEAIGPFKSAASKLLDYITQDANQQSRRDVYLNISHMIEEVSDDKTPWMADVIVAGINKVEYDDKLAYLAAAGPDQRLRRATELFIKQASISGSVEHGVIRYTYDEKIHIARKFLPPKQLKANGLTPEHITLTDSALLHIATHYTREAGVRSLERAISAVVRYKAVEWAEFSDVTGITDIKPRLERRPLFCV